MIRQKEDGSFEEIMQVKEEVIPAHEEVIKTFWLDDLKAEKASMENQVIELNAKIAEYDKKVTDAEAIQTLPIKKPIV